MWNLKKYVLLFFVTTIVITKTAWPMEQKNDQKLTTQIPKIEKELLPTIEDILKSIDHNGRTILHKAAHEGNVKHLTVYLKELMMFGIFPDIEDRTKKTPLHLAVRSGNLEAVAILLIAHANPNAQDLKGFTPLHDAVITNQIEIVKLLLKFGANINVKTYKNAPYEAYTPLDFARTNKMQNTILTSPICDKKRTE
jgi:ankyrin repeat protein